jgi:AcrR family transcriptional regulator
MTTSPDPARPTVGLRERKKAKTRASIQTHALRLFQEQGYSATTVDQIAEAAEISQSTFFRYFPSKEAVVLADDIDPLWLEAVLRQPPELSPLAAVRAAFKEVYSSLSPELWERERARQQLIYSVPELRSTMFDQFIAGLRVLTTAMAERVGRPVDDFNVRVLAGALIGVSLAAAAESGPMHMTDDFFERVDAAVALLEAGLPL